MATITKRDLVNKICFAVGKTQQEIFTILQKTFDTIAENLAAGDEVVLRNFGTFHIRQTKPKVGRNPNQPEKDVTIPARSVVKFKPGKELKQRVADLLPQTLKKNTP